MSKYDVAKKLMRLKQAKRDAVIDNAMSMYANQIAAIAMDIYDSCIRCYYAAYKPVVYDRHGNKAGINLYQANNVVMDEMKLDLNFDEDSLDEYDEDEDIRQEVLENVFAGIRGTGFSNSPTKGRKKWPKKWRAQYPNRFSRYKYWASSGGTLNDIFEEFSSNIIEDTTELFWKCVQDSM